MHVVAFDGGCSFFLLLLPGRLLVYFVALEKTHVEKTRTDR